jgi:ribosomal protein L20
VQSQGVPAVSRRGDVLSVRALRRWRCLMFDRPVGVVVCGCVVTHAALACCPPAAMREKHKEVLKMAKGFRGRAKNCWTVASHKVDKSLQYAYIGRKLKKRNFRKLWIQQARCRALSLAAAAAAASLWCQRCARVAVCAVLCSARLYACGPACVSWHWLPAVSGAGVVSLWSLCCCAALQINAAVRQYDVKYSHFVADLQKSNIELNRKVLADLAVTEPFSFRAVVDVTKLVKAQEVLE